MVAVGWKAPCTHCALHSCIKYRISDHCFKVQNWWHECTQETQISQAKNNLGAEGDHAEWNKYWVQVYLEILNEPPKYSSRQPGCRVWKMEVTKVRSATTKPWQRLAAQEAMTFGCSQQIPVVAIMIATFTTSSVYWISKLLDRNYANRACSTKRLFWKKNVTLSLHLLQGRHASHEPAAQSSKSGWSVWFETPGTSIVYSTCKLLNHQYEQTREVRSSRPLALGAQCSPIKSIQIM